MLKQYTNEAMVNDFLKGMLTEAGMAELDPTLEEEMMNSLRARLQERFFATVLKNLSDEQITEFRKLDENNADEQEVGKFIEENLPNPAEIFSEAMLQFRADYLGI